MMLKDKSKKEEVHMAGKKCFAVIVIFLTAVGFMFGSAIKSDAQKPKAAPVCVPCHKPDEKTLRGVLTRIEAGAIQMEVGPATWLVKVVPSEAKLTGAKILDEIPKGRNIAVGFREEKGELYAVSVSVKQPAKVPEEKLIKTDQLLKLIVERADMLIVDSRPAARYHEDHIPGAISIFFADFDKNIDKLPKEKNKLLIFYCGGPT
jgi:hypothetical protein